jgi:hypothetical protein
VDVDLATGCDPGLEGSPLPSERSHIETVMPIGRCLQASEPPCDESLSPDEVAALHVHAGDRELDDSLPELPLGPRRVLPGDLEELVRLEVALLGPPDRTEFERVRDIDRLERLGHRDTDGAVGQRPTGAIARPRLLRAAIIASVTPTHVGLRCPRRG